MNSDRALEVHDNYRILDCNDPQKFMMDINSESLHTYRKKVIFFNTDGWRNNKKSSEYTKIFDKDVISLVVDARLTTDKLNIVKSIAEKKISLYLHKQTQRQLFLVAPLLAYLRIIL